MAFVTPLAESTAVGPSNFHQATEPSKAGAWVSAANKNRQLNHRIGLGIINFMVFPDYFFPMMNKE
jgi:hypothetical protein